MTTIKEQYHASMSIAESQKLILQTLKNVMEEKICTDNVEVTVITTESKKMRNLGPEELEAIIDTLA